MPWFTKKERRMQVSAFPAIFKADFGRFGLFRPYRPPADMTRYGWYSPILAESTRFGTNRAALVQIEPSRREFEKKKKVEADRRAGNRVERGCDTSGATFVLSSSLQNQELRI